MAVHTPEELGLAETMAPTGGDPKSDELAGYTHERIGGLVMQQLFDRKPKTPKIGRYSVLERIGRGGMGTVFSAYDEELDRKVAIKILSKGTDNELASMRLKREAQAMARLSHPNVATVHEVGEADGEVFVAMEFIRGQSLDAWIRDEPEWHEVLEVFVQAGRGIIAAHDAGLIHRDLKPHNIMRTESGVVKVLDFGLARTDLSESEDDAETPIPSSESVRATSALDATLTKTGTVLGTPAYMAPEQHEGRPTGFHSDQFSYCVALYEALYGCRPFEGQTLGALVYAITQQQPKPPPSESRVPAWVHRIVLRGLRREPEERWSSMRALLQALGRDPARSRRRRLTVAGLGLLAGLGGVAISELRTPVEAPCPEVAAETEALWPEERQVRIAAAFVATGSDLAEDTSSRMAEPIEAYVDALGQMRSEACEVHRRGQQSARVFDLRSACLDIRRAGFDRLLGAFENADASTVDNAAWALASLPGLSTCADVNALTAAVPPPEDEQVARQVKEHRESLARASSLVLAGSHEAAGTQARQTLREAEALGYPPLVAEALLVLGTSLMESFQHEAAHETLSRSIAEALRSAHYEVAVEALARRSWVVADPLRRPAEARVDGEIADSLLDNLGRPTALQWLLLNNRGVAQFRSGAMEEAEGSYRDALEVVGSADAGAYPVELISTRFNLAMLLSSGLGQPEAAADELRSTRAQGIALLGPTHPRVATMSMLLGENLLSAGRPAQALEILETELERLRPSDAFTRALMLTELARLHLFVRRDSRALDAAMRALHVTTEFFPDDYLRSIALWYRGVSRVALGETESGFEDLRRALDRERERSGPDHEFVANVRWWVGHALLRDGRLDDAIGEFERVREIDAKLDSSALGDRSFTLVAAYLERGNLSRAETLLLEIAEAQDNAGFSKESQYRLVLDQRRGDLLMATGDASAAARAYEVACTGFAQTFEPDNPELAECRLSWARALGSGAQALVLAEQAAEAYSRLGEGFSPEHAEAETFMNSL